MCWSLYLQQVSNIMKKCDFIVLGNENNMHVNLNLYRRVLHFLLA